MNKPIIGIVSKHYATYKSNKIDTFVRDEIKQAIFDNGGIAIGILPTESGINYCGDEWKDNLSIEEKENLIAQIKLCNGIILQGGLETDNYESIISKYVQVKIILLELLAEQPIKYITLISMISHLMNMCIISKLIKTQNFIT